MGHHGAVSHFVASGEHIAASFSYEERAFLRDVLPLLASLGEPGKDPAATRLNVPVYLGDPEANEEWWRLSGPELEAGRRSDRDIYRRVLEEDDDGVLMSEDEALAFLRVVNEARLALGARFGVKVEDDADHLPVESRQVMDYLGWVLEELTEALSEQLTAES